MWLAFVFMCRVNFVQCIRKFIYVIPQVYYMIFFYLCEFLKMKIKKKTHHFLHFETLLG